MQQEFNSLDRISPLVASQVPEFIRIEHPTFIAFLNAYYEWLETQGSKLRNSMDLAKVKDIDTTFDEYVEYFKNQYLLDFPENLALNQTTRTPVEEKTLVKYIKQFYRAKGTEKTFEFLFRILYDTNVEFYYPKVDILKASDGKWILRKSIRIGGAQGNLIFESAGKRIYQRNALGDVSAAASVIDVSKYQAGSFVVYELNLSNINGTFVASKEIEIETNSDIIIEPKIYSGIASISITNGGSGYRVGDQVRFTNATGDDGFAAKAYVDQVNSAGKILKIVIDNFGLNYDAPPTITVVSRQGTNFTGTCSIGVICNFEGYYANNDGRLNSNKVIQDNHYYQNYSYVLKAEVVVNRYRDIIKRLIHPAGLGFFGEVLIKRCAASDFNTKASLFKYEIPLIGHYVPYTNRTYGDLKQWFTLGLTAYGYSPAVHDTVLSANPNPPSSGFVIPSSPLQTPGFPGADPWWIIYQHPNRRITNPVSVRIEYDLFGLSGPNSSGAGKRDFLNGTNGSSYWSEWQLTATSDRQSWINGFTSGFKYTTLRYSNTSEFRKIVLGGFFSIPLGEQFNCSNEWFDQSQNINPNSLLRYTDDGSAGSLTGGLTGTEAYPDIESEFELPPAPPSSSIPAEAPRRPRLGCMDSIACNYDGLATQDDGSCDYNCYGCMDAGACNYDPNATKQYTYSCDYSCVGCTDFDACNYNPTATIDDGSCDYSCFGCMDPVACNYDPTSTDPNPDNCIYLPLGCSDCSSIGPGCRDSNACNYNPCATTDDGSCIYNPPGSTGCADWPPIDPEPPRRGPPETIVSPASSAAFVVLGCTDPEACNYDSEANVNDYSCIYCPDYRCPSENCSG